MTNSKQIVRQAMVLRNMSIERLAAALGYKRGSNVASKLNCASEMSIKAFMDMMNALGCEVIVRDTMGSKQKWTLEDLPEEV